MGEAIVTLVSIVALLLGSPGPAPLALAAVGASVGIKKGIPFLLGILCGLSVAIVVAVLGHVTLVALHPMIKTVVQVLGALYILYIAFKIAVAPLVVTDSTLDTTPSFSDGFILNLLNPKAYAAFFAIFSQFLLPSNDLVSAFVLTAAICIIVATFVDAVWLLLGGAIKPIFAKPLQARLLRVCFACLMVVAVAMTLFSLK